MARSNVILVIGGDTKVADDLSRNLEQGRCEVRHIHDGPAAIADVQRRIPDLVVLDRTLADMSGDEVAIRLRGDPRTSNVPIVVLSDRSEVTDELISFALGADDFVRKPFSNRVLVARIRAILRRSQLAKEPAEVLSIGPVTLDRSRHELAVNDAPVAVTATEFRLLGALMSASGRVLSRDQLIDAALGVGAAVTDRTIDVHVAGLRRKLGAAADWINTIRGVGYTFRTPPPDEPHVE